MLDPGATRVTFRLGATLHTVEGSLDLLQGELRFAPEGGPAEGTVVVDATSADTGLERRDRGMHAEVLESERFPRIVFHAERLRVERLAPPEAEVRLEGELAIHGGRHRLTIPATLRGDGARVAFEARFRIPYVEWGMKDVSTFLLRVDDVVEVSVQGEGRIEPPVTSRTGERKESR